MTSGMAPHVSGRDCQHEAYDYFSKNLENNLLLQANKTLIGSNITTFKLTSLVSLESILCLLSACCLLLDNAFY